MLFVGHDASRTGAPLMLLHLLRWLREHTDIDFDLVLRRGGELVPEYSRVCTVFEVSSFWRVRAALDALRDRERGPRPDGPALFWRARAVLDGLRSRPRGSRPYGPLALRGILGRRQIGLVYSNTLINGRTLAELALDCPVVCHAHEVESYIQRMDPEEVSGMLRGASMFVVVSEAMRDSLLRRGVEPGRIEHVPGFAPLGNAGASDPGKRAMFRRQHGIPKDAILVGGCGTPHWQKGADLLVYIASMLIRETGSGHVHFAWVGGRDQDLGLFQLRWDIERAGLAGRFSVIPHLADPIEYFASLDILAMVSRDDPLPLVAVEAGARGVPVVSFEGSATFLDRDCGVIVPYLDLQGYAKAIRELADDGPRRARLGERLAASLRGRHDVSVGASQIAGIIRSFLRGAARS